MIRRVCAVAALIAVAVAVAVVVVVTRSDTHACSEIDYAGFRSAPEAASDQLNEVGARIAYCDDLAGLSRRRVHALLGDASPIGATQEIWPLGAGAMDDNVLVVAYDAAGRVNEVQVAWR